MSLTPGRILYLTQRRCKLGLRHWYAEHFIFHRIESWKVNLNWPQATIPIHLLACQYDWRMALWMLASFHHATQRRWPIILHEDGSLGEKEFAIFKKLFPKIQIIPRQIADQQMAPLLKKYPRCADYRHRMPHGLKSFDIPAITPSSRYLMIDPDVLFFKQPTEILQWADRPDDLSCWFNEDLQEASPISPRQSQEDLGINLWHRVNSGLALLNRDTVNNLDDMEQWLAHPALQTPNMQWRIEQTLLALAASKANLGGLLPKTYEISSQKHRAPHAISRHYIGCVRDRFLSEGVIDVFSLLN